MNENLLNKEFQDFLENHYKEETSKMAFQGSPFPNISTREFLVQLSGKKKAEKKIPTWFNSRGIIYPPNINLEQTSSEVTAEYKTSLVSGKTLIDLTGGFGIDSFHFSKQVEKVYHLELNEELQEIAAHNFRTLGAENVISKAGNGIEFLKNTSEEFDWIYLDPSRRDDAGGKVFVLSDCLPNIPQNLELLQERGRKILIKTSPLLDLQAGIRELDGVKEIHVVAVENEVKELLWVLEKNTSETIKITTINFRKKGDQVYETTLGSRQVSNFHTPLTYLYEPNAAIMKSGVFDPLGNDFALFKLHFNTHLYTSDELKDFPGRRFKIEQILPYKKKIVKAALKEGKAHVTTRNFPESVVSIRKKLNLKDGGDTYLFFTTIEKDERVVLVCIKR